MPARGSRALKRFAWRATPSVGTLYVTVSPVRSLPAHHRPRLVGHWPATYQASIAERRLQELQAPCRRPPAEYGPRSLRQPSPTSSTSRWPDLQLTSRREPIDGPAAAREAKLPTKHITKAGGTRRGVGADPAAAAPTLRSAAKCNERKEGCQRRVR